MGNFLPDAVDQAAAVLAFMQLNDTDDDVYRRCSF